MNAYEFLSTKKTDMYRWWQAADRDPSGREVLVDVSVYCKVWRGKVRERMTHTLVGVLMTVLKTQSWE